MRSARFLAAALVLLGMGAAWADVSISTKPTQNMSCSAGLCTPTAKKVVLNVGDLANMLVGGDVKISSGSLAQNIEIDAALSWTSTHRLTLDTYYSIAFNKPVVVAGTGALTITTNDGGSGGDFRFLGKGHIEFWDTTSSLIINGQSYMLVKKLKDLSNAIKANPLGLFALAASYNAKRDGNYVNSALPGLSQTQTFEGLGHAISNLSIIYDGRNSVAGLFPKNRGMIRDLGVANVTIGLSGESGGIAGDNHGTIANSYVTGTINAYIAGGLAGANEGVIRNSHADVAIKNAYDEAFLAGGLVGVNISLLETSYATGAVFDGNSAGGLVGENEGAIENSYTRGGVNGVNGGGLVGHNNMGTISDSYSTGEVAGSVVGGFVGIDNEQNNADTYWDLDTSGITDPDQGAGDPLNDPGITGLTTAQLQASLPVGFDKKVWKEKANINGGYPYLIDLPPN